MRLQHPSRDDFFPKASGPFSKPIDVMLPDRSIVLGTFEIWEEDPQNPKYARITLRFGGRDVSGKHASYNHALNIIRGELEREGILLKCYGSSRNVWHSSVTAGMGRGGKAYKHYQGKKSEQVDIVSIFDSGPDVDPCTLEEQKHFYRQWQSSVGIGRD